MKKIKVLITGGSGFIGSALIKRFLGKQYNLTILLRKKDAFKNENVNIIRGDLKNKDDVLLAVKGQDLIYNAGAVLPHHNLPKKEYWLTNFGGVRNITEASLKFNVKRLIHVSTVGVYGSTELGIANESSLANPQDVYAKSKFEAEKHIFSLRKKGLKFVIIKPTIGYGPGDMRPGFIDLLRLVKVKLFAPMVGDGENFFHTVYVDNLIDALVLCAIKKEALYEDFIIGDDPCFKMKDIMKAMYKVRGKDMPFLNMPKSLAYLLGFGGDFAEKLGLKSSLTTQRVKFLTQNKRFSINKAKKMLGYKPRVNFQMGIVNTYKWYQEKNLI